MKAFAARTSPALALMLAGLWLLLNQTVAAGHVVLGLALGFALAMFAGALRPLRARLRRADTALLLFLVVLKDVLHSNLIVARVVLRSAREGRDRSAFVCVPLELRDPHGLAALAVILTATPGNVWAGLSATGDALTLHVLDLEDEARLIALIKTRYESPLMRIFE